MPRQHASGLPSAMPYQVVQTLVLCTTTFRRDAAPSVRLLPTARRSGSPVLRRPDLTTGRSGVSQVTGPSSSAVPQSSTPPVPLRLAHSASGDAAFMVAKPLSIRDEHFEAAIPVAQLARLTTHQPPPYGDDCKSDYQPAGYALTGWGSHPLDGSSKFQSTSADLLSDRHCLVASSNRLLGRQRVG